MHMDESMRAPEGAFEDDEFQLTEIIVYVRYIVFDLSHRGLSKDEIQFLIDGYDSIIQNELYPEDISANKAATALLQLHADKFQKQKSNRSLFEFSHYVSLVIGELVNFGYSPEDSLDMVDDFDEELAVLYPLVLPRVAARRIASMNRRLEAGRGLHEE